MREPPRERFAGGRHVVDLRDVFERLPAESVARGGHIQKALYKHGRLTSAAFAFEAGGRLESHRVDGEAVVHVLEGRLAIVAEGDRLEIRAGQIALLDPGIDHEIEALEQTRVLMHVVLESD